MSFPNCITPLVGIWSANLPPRRTSLLCWPLTQGIGGPPVIESSASLLHWEPKRNTFGYRDYEDVIRMCIYGNAVFMPIPNYEPAACGCPHSCPLLPPSMDSAIVRGVIDHWERLDGIRYEPPQTPREAADVLLLTPEFDYGGEIESACDRPPTGAMVPPPKWGEQGRDYSDRTFTRQYLGVPYEEVHPDTSPPPVVPPSEPPRGPALLAPPARMRAGSKGAGDTWLIGGKTKGTPDER